MLVLTLAGLAVAAATAIADRLLDPGRRGRRGNILLVLGMLALVLAGCAAYLQSQEKVSAARAAQVRHDALAAQLESTRRELAALSGVSAISNALLGDLTKLNALGGGASYFVRIAADSKPERLEPYVQRIEAQFAGARASSLVSIRPPKTGRTLHVLAFGRGLTLASAEVFQRLATSHRFPPPNQVAAIEREE